MLPLSVEAVKGKQKTGMKNPEFFSLNKIKPGMNIISGLMSVPNHQLFL